MIEISIENPLLEKIYPGKGDGVMAILDTGYSGFLFIPKKLFGRLRLSDLKPTIAEASLADGSSLRLTGAFGSIEFPSLGLEIDGLIETSEGAEEILLGMKGVRCLLLEIDCCLGRVEAQDCSLN